MQDDSVKPAKEWKMDLSLEEMKELVDTALHRIVKADDTPIEVLVKKGDDQYNAVTQELKEAEIPMQGNSLDNVLSELTQHLQYGRNTKHPGYMCFAPSGGLYYSALADFIAGYLLKYTGYAIASPACVQIECNVIRWLCNMVGYPSPSSFGFLNSGASSSNVSAVVIARNEMLPENFLNGTLYVSDQVHHSIFKAAKAAGFPARNVRVIPSDESCKLSLDALSAAINKDREEGLQPFFVVAHYGTVNSGVVDDLSAIAEIAKREKLWLHVDGAIGGFFMMTEEGKRLGKGMELADSIAIDPHKSMFLTYGTGCLLVKDRHTLERMYQTESALQPYIPAAALTAAVNEDDWLADFAEVTPEQTRPFRGLRLWLPLKLIGAETFVQCLDEKLQLAKYLSDQLEAIGKKGELLLDATKYTYNRWRLEVTSRPIISILNFRLVPVLSSEGEGSVEDAEVSKRVNAELLRLVNEVQRVLLYPTVVKGAFVLRVCILSFRTHMEQIEHLLEDINGALQKLTK